MNIEKMKQFAELASQLKKEGVYGFGIEENRFHVSQKEIKGLENLEIKVRDDLNSDFPFEISHKGDGFVVFSLATKDNLKQFPQFKDFFRKELLKQLRALEEGEQVNEQSTSAV
jgi:uncharacterized membrane protein YukC